MKAQPEDEDARLVEGSACGAVVFYLTHAGISDYVRAEATKYRGETREALERIANLIDNLNELD